MPTIGPPCPLSPHLRSDVAFSRCRTVSVSAKPQVWPALVFPVAKAVGSFACRLQAGRSKSGSKAVDASKRVLRKSSAAGDSAAGMCVGKHVGSAHSRCFMRLMASKGAGSMKQGLCYNLLEPLPRITGGMDVWKGVDAGAAAKAAARPGLGSQPMVMRLLSSFFFCSRLGTAAREGQAKSDEAAGKTGQTPRQPCAVFPWRQALPQPITCPCPMHLPPTHPHTHTQYTPSAHRPAPAPRSRSGRAPRPGWRCPACAARAPRTGSCARSCRELRRGGTVEHSRAADEGARGQTGMFGMSAGGCAVCERGTHRWNFTPASSLSSFFSCACCTLMRSTSLSTAGRAGRGGKGGGVGDAAALRRDTQRAAPPPLSATRL